MKKIFIVIGLVSGLLYACQNRSSDENKNTVKKQDTVNHREEHHAEPATPVSLNNGEKWNANAETHDGIKNMLRLIQDFPVKSELSDYQQLKRELESEFNLILKKCTMKGEAHSQLHNYLLPMQGMFAKLESSDIEVRNEALAKLNQHLLEYTNYFQ